MSLMSSTSACKCGTFSGGSRMPTNPLMPGPARISSMLMGSSSSLCRDLFFGLGCILSGLDIEKLHHFFGRHTVVLGGLAMRVQIHQEPSGALRFRDGAVGSDGGEQGNPILLGHGLQRFQCQA